MVIDNAMSLQYSSLQVLREDHPPCWKLCTTVNEGREIEEFVFTMHGIISDEDLPPFVSP